MGGTQEGGKAPVGLCGGVQGGGWRSELPSLSLVASHAGQPQEALPIFPPEESPNKGGSFVTFPSGSAFNIWFTDEVWKPNLATEHSYRGRDCPFPVLPCAVSSAAAAAASHVQVASARALGRLGWGVDQ